MGDGGTGGECEHGEGRYGVSVRVAHEHDGEMGAVHADVDVVEGTDVGGAADGEHVVRGERGGRDKPTEDGGADDNPTEAEDVSVRALQGASTTPLSFILGRVGRLFQEVLKNQDPICSSLE